MDRRTALSTWLPLVLASKVTDIEDRVTVSDTVLRVTGRLPESVYGPINVYELTDEQVTELAASVQTVAEHDARFRRFLRYWEETRGQRVE